MFLRRDNYVAILLQPPSPLPHLTTICAKKYNNIKKTVINVWPGFAHMHPENKDQLSQQSYVYGNHFLMSQCSLRRNGTQKRH